MYKVVNGTLLVALLLLLLRNISQTKRGEQDGYLGGDWKVEQVAWAISLCVWFVKRARSPPVDEKLERMRSCGVLMKAKGT